MKHILATTVLTLAMTSVVNSTQAIANTFTDSSPADHSPAVLQQPYSATTGDTPERTNTSDKQIQPLKQTPSDTQSKPSKDRLNQFYPAYCESFLFNVEPGSWQFKQDIQRCVYGQ